MWEVELYDLDLNREYRINGVERSRSEYYNGVTFFLDSYEHMDILSLCLSVTDINRDDPTRDELINNNKKLLSLNKTVYLKRTKFHWRSSKQLDNDCDIEIIEE
jgi:hypothetical protein